MNESLLKTEHQTIQTLEADKSSRNNIQNFNNLNTFATMESALNTNRDLKPNDPKIKKISLLGLVNGGSNKSDLEIVTNAEYVTDATYGTISNKSSNKLSKDKSTKPNGERQTSEADLEKSENTKGN